MSKRKRNTNDGEEKKKGKTNGDKPKKVGFQDNNNNEIKESLTVSDIKLQLGELGVEFNSKSTKKQLLELLNNKKEETKKEEKEEKENPKVEEKLESIVKEETKSILKKATKSNKIEKKVQIQGDEEEESTQEVSYQSPTKKKSYKISTTIHAVTKKGEVELVNMKQNDVGLQMSHMAHSVVSMRELNRQQTMFSATDLSTEIFQFLQLYFLPIEGFAYELNKPSHIWEEPIKNLPLEKVVELCHKVKELFKREASLVKVAAPCYVFGDLHGNYEDLSFFAKMAWGMGVAIAPTKFLFLGDYVDRGPHSIEVSLYLFCMKLKAPNKVFLLRGNHEDRDVNGDTEIYKDGSFMNHCIKNYGEKEGNIVFKEINDVFDYLPLAAIVDEKIFCAHGGIPRRCVESKDILTEIATIPRPPDFQDPLVYDLLWADPAKTNDRKNLGKKGFHPFFSENKRGEGTCCFGPKAVDYFLEQTGCSHLIRAHERENVGISFISKAKVLTVFSSSHYCGSGNMACCLLINESKLNVIMKQNNENLSVEDEEEDEE